MAPSDTCRPIKYPPGEALQTSNNLLIYHCRETNLTYFRLTSWWQHYVATHETHVYTNGPKQLLDNIGVGQALHVTQLVLMLGDSQHGLPTHGTHVTHLPRVSSSCSTTEGSARVDTSPSSLSCLEAILRSTRRMILPERVLGRPAWRIHMIQSVVRLRYVW